MTITLTPRRAAVLGVTLLAFLAAYLLGAARSGGSVASASGTAPVSVPASVLTASTSPATSSGTGSGITVTGTGKVTGTPDTLMLDLTVSTTGSSVTSALASANTIEARVQKSLQGKGVATKDMQTSGLSIQPQYDYRSNGEAVLKGYQVSESLSVLLRNLTTAGTTINTAVAAGGNAVQVNGVGLDLSDSSALLQAARKAAYVQAKDKAQEYATAAGRSLGAPVSISEVVDNPAINDKADYSAAGGAASAPVPIQAGSQAVSVTVTVVFAFG